MKKRKKTLSYEKQKARFAYLLLIPFLTGFVLFFLQPFVLSFIYSINYVSLKGADVIYSFKGYDYYYESLFVNTEFRLTFVNGVRHLFSNIPLVLIFSLFIATVLNKPFWGRNVSRVILFLPVIITTGVLLAVESGDYLINEGINAVASKSATYEVNKFDLQTLLLNLKLPVQVMNFLSAVISEFYNILISSGVQITIFLAALQSISPSLYEASAIEGATAWEDFWKITLPMVSPYIYVCALYSIIDSFSNPTNSIVSFIRKVAFETELNYGLASAMSWIYFVVTAIIIGIISLLFRKIRHS